MTPERERSIRAQFKRGVFGPREYAHVRDLLAEIDRLRAENGKLREAAGGVTGEWLAIMRHVYTHHATGYDAIIPAKRYEYFVFLVGKLATVIEGGANS